VTSYKCKVYHSQSDIDKHLCKFVINFGVMTGCEVTLIRQYILAEKLCLRIKMYSINVA
jgi:hypothetical protein